MEKCREIFQTSGLLKFAELLKSMSNINWGVADRHGEVDHQMLFNGTLVGILWRDLWTFGRFYTYVQSPTLNLSSFQFSKWSPESTHIRWSAGTMGSNVHKISYQNTVVHKNGKWMPLITIVAYLEERYFVMWYFLHGGHSIMISEISHSSWLFSRCLKSIFQT